MSAKKTARKAPAKKAVKAAKKSPAKKAAVKKAASRKSVPNKPVKAGTSPTDDPWESAKKQVKPLIKDATKIARAGLDTLEKHIDNPTLKNVIKSVKSAMG